MVENILVVKFGGSCLSTSETILAAARKIASEVAKGKGVVVVVSAMKDATDELLKLAKNSTSNKSYLLNSRGMP